MVLDVTNGEVLALANLPSYNPNNRGKLDPRRTRNRAVTDLFEPGSTLKPFTAAAALEAGHGEAGKRHPDRARASSPSATARSTTPIRRARSPCAQVIQKSSNVGAAKIALGLKPETLWAVFNRVGFGVPPRSGFPGEVSGRLRAHATWRPIEQATMSYGHGISVSLLQLARAYMVFATDGELKPVTLIKRDGPPESVQVIAPETARRCAGCWRWRWRPGEPRRGRRSRATASRARPGPRTRSKAPAMRRTSTSPSFVGFAPASAPRLIVAVMIDEPSAGQYYGGAVARRCLRM